MVATTHPTLVNSFLGKENTMLRNVLLVIAGSIALWISAKINVPYYPVPATMQTFVVMIIGMAFGWKLGAATVGLYLAQGAAGLPVFAGTPEKGLGLLYMAGPTGGFLLGFVLAAIAVGYLAERGFDRNIFTTAIAMLVGTALIYIPGLLYLGSLLGWDKPILQWGMIPFLYLDAMKIVLAALLMPVLWKFIGRKP